MKIHQSKRNLYLDNIKMQKQIERLVAANIELAIMNETNQHDIDKANKEIDKINNRL